MITRKILFLMLLLPLISAGEVKAGDPPYMTPGNVILDQFAIQLFNAEDQKCDEVSIRMNNSTFTDVYDAKKGDAIDQGATYENLKIRKNTVIDGKLIPTYQSKIVMPYGDSYFLDIPLLLERMEKGADYYLKLSHSSWESAVKIVQITDANTGVVSGNLFNDDVVLAFTSPSDKTEYEFTIRIYGGEPFKESATINGGSNRWNNASNWLSGKLPGENSYVILPEGTQIIIGEGEDFRVGYITNLGTLINNGALEVTDFMEVSSK